MISSLYRLIDKKYVLILLAMLISSPTLAGKNTYTICLIYSHFLTMYLNNVYIFTLYRWASHINTLSSFYIIRTSQNQLYLSLFLSFTSITCLYTFIIYISYYIFFGPIPKQDMTLTVYFMIINFIISLLETLIIYMQIGKQKNFAYLVFPIFINVLFHMIFTSIF